MNLKLWQVGIDIQQNYLVAIALQANKNRYRLKKWWHIAFAQPLLDPQQLGKHQSLLSALITLRQQLPSKISLRTALPDSSVLQQVLTLPPHPLSETELAWFVTASLNRLFPMAPDELAIDYRIHQPTPMAPSKKVTITAARRVEIDQWVNLFSQAKLTLDAIDIKSSIMQFIIKISKMSENELSSVSDWSALNIVCDIPLPAEPSQFVLACGLALRGDDY